MDTIFTKIKDHFTSIRNVLTVLAFLGIASAIGTLVPQNQDPLFYTQKYGPNFGQLIVSTGVANLFRSWWFTIAEIWLVVSLLICTYYRGEFAVRLSRRDAKKGLGAWGLTVLHVGLVFVLLTLMFTPRVAEESRVNAAPGDIASLTAQGFPFDLEIKSFKVEYYPDGTPKQYITRCAVLENGKSVREESISVNYPLKHRGVKVYQMNYGMLLRGRLTVGEVTVPFETVPDQRPYPVDSQFALLTQFYPDFVYDMNGRPATRSQEPKNPYVLYVLYNQNEPVKMDIIPVGKAGEIPDGEIVFDGFAQYTGLQVKRNPALPYTFAGFILATVGVFLYLIFNPRRRPDTGQDNNKIAH
ncbi:MAG: cytochrome c biogenesis protein ResB [Bacillota bacterium]